MSYELLSYEVASYTRKVGGHNGGEGGVRHLGFKVTCDV